MKTYIDYSAVERCSKIKSCGGYDCYYEGCTSCTSFGVSYRDLHNIEKQTDVSIVKQLLEDLLNLELSNYEHSAVLQTISLVEATYEKILKEDV